MKDKKSLFEQVAAIIFGLSLVAGVGFLFFAACAHAFSGPTAPYRANTSMYISLGLAGVHLVHDRELWLQRRR